MHNLGIRNTNQEIGDQITLVILNAIDISPNDHTYLELNDMFLIFFGAEQVVTKNMNINMFIFNDVITNLFMPTLFYIKGYRKNRYALIQSRSKYTMTVQI